MRRVIMMAMVMLMAASSALIISVDDSDGVSQVTDGSTWYCYGDHPTFIFPGYSDGVNITWDVTDSYGNSIVPESSLEDRIQIDMTGLDRITVTQTVSAQGVEEDSITIQVIPLHIPSGTSYRVVFHDGGNIVDMQYVDNTTVIEFGENHAIAPIIEKDGYEFQGWFDEDGINEIDLTQPITGETHLYAKWKYTGVSGGSSDTIVVSETHTVTFNTSVGLECTPSEPGSNSLMFTVSVIGGYELIGAVSVTSTGGTITQVADGQYLLSGIDSNIIVNITGETVYTEDPDDDITDDNPEEPSINNGNDYTLYAILLIILAVICIALAVYIMRTRGSRV